MLKQDKLYKLVMNTFILLMMIVIGFPLLLTISVSLQTMREIYASSPVIIPMKPQFINYATALTNGNWGRYLFNSLYISVLTVVISLIINSMSGYVFARIPFKGRNVLFLTILIGMMIPPQVTMVPVFTLLRSVPFAGGNDIHGQGGLGLINTYAGLIIPFIAGSFGVFLCRQFYLDFPLELDDAAQIDGCGRFTTFIRIYLPLSGPVLASLSVLKFTGTWNEFTWPLIMTNSDSMKTVQIALTMFRDEAEILWNQLMAAMLVANIAIYIVFLFTQRFFISGLLAGSVKG